MDLRQLVTTLRRRGRFVVAVFLSGLVGAFLISVVVTPMHEATVRVYLSASGNEVFDQVQMGLYTAQRAKSYAALAEDDTVLRNVIDRAGAAATPEDLAERVDLEVLPETVVLRLAVRDADPAVARKLAEAYAAEIATTVAKLERPAAGAGGDRRSPVTARTLGEPSLSDGPVSPNLPLNLAVGALLGLLFGIGGALLRESLAEASMDRAPLPPRPRPRNTEVLSGQLR